ncbi:MAG: DUF4297 domain-containing protein [Fusobacterium sp.]|nr:DUF4297 domain-containing protein [Fusobacterium sp.]MCM1053814.1 DUF4297 domain-containing protein [Ruminococcus sp.]
MLQTHPNTEYIDNGGANAKKGFNYQDAIATLIIITNFSKDDFCIYLECNDDIEVDLTSYKFFIQVKSSKQRISNLIKQNKKKDGTYNKSILFKNLDKTCPSNKVSKYKIVTTGYTDGISTINGEIFKDIYYYTDEQKKQIIEKLKEQGFNQQELEEKLKNSYIYVSPFDDNFEKAYTFLLGIMAEVGISVDNNRGKMLLNELLVEIHKKSEKKIVVEQDIDKKKIKKDDLTKLSKVENCFKYMEEITTRLENTNIITFSDKITINEYLRVIDLKHKSECKLVDEILQDTDISGKPEDIIKNIHNSLSSTNIEPKLLYAILIDKYVMNAIYEGK